MRDRSRTHGRRALSGWWLLAAGALVHSIPSAAGCGGSCDSMFCDCSHGDGDSDPPDSASNVAESLAGMLRYLRGPLGLPLNYLVPLSYWTSGHDRPNGGSAPELTAAERVKLSFGFRLRDGGAAQLALALRGRWSAASAVSDMLREPSSPARAAGPRWLYGESGRTFSAGDDIGYYSSLLSERDVWPDPAALAAGNCWWTDYRQRCAVSCDEWVNSSPALYDTVWGGLIAPLHTDWLKFYLDGGHAMPSSPPSLQLQSSILTALQVSSSRFGGYYEAPLEANSSAQLKLSVASNAALQAAATMAAQAVTDRGTQQQLQVVRANCSALLNSSAVWDSSLGLFRDEVVVPAGAKEPVATAGSTVRTQLTVLHAVGRRLDWAAGGAGRALAVWQRTLELYGTKNGAGVVVGLVDDEAPQGCNIDSEVTLRAVAAGRALARQFGAAMDGRPADAATAARFRSDAATMAAHVSAGATATPDASVCPQLACHVRSNATLQSSDGKGGGVVASSLAYLSADGQWRPGKGLPALHPLPSLAATAWGVIALAASDDALPFSPYELPLQTPGPPIPSKRDGGGGDGWLLGLPKLDWLFLVCGCVAAAALVVSVGKAVRIHRRRRRGQELKEEEQHILSLQPGQQGRNLGFV